MALRDTHSTVGGRTKDENELELSKIRVQLRELKKAIREYLEAADEFALESWKHKITPETIRKKKEAEERLTALLTL